MKTIAHVIFDEKFFDDVIEVNEYITKNKCKNEYLIVTWLGIKKHFKYTLIPQHFDLTLFISS